MDRTGLLHIWCERKAIAGAGYHLREPYDQRFVFRGPQWGHPSNYADVFFHCTPAERLSFDAESSWPEQLSVDECHGLELAIACGIGDGLLGAALRPRWVCRITLVEIGWDDLMSSEEAFYRATKGAMAALIERGPWRLG